MIVFFKAVIDLLTPLMVVANKKKMYVCRIKIEVKKNTFNDISFLSS
jgi:hypothetical protein